MSGRPLGPALVFAFVAAHAGAVTFYVSNDGDNGADGLTPETAWQTLQHAADQVAAGDTVIALAGSYDGFNLFTSGQPGQPITFTADPGALAANPAVVIDQPNGFTGQDGINLEGASWVVVEGFTIAGAGIPRAGIRAVGTSGSHAGNVTVRANHIDEPGRWGIFTGFVDDLLIEDNETSRAGDEHGIYASNSGDRPVIRRNLIWGNRSNGIHMNGDLSQGGDGVISDALVEANVTFDNGTGGGSGINCDGLQNSTIRNNLIYDGHASGISLYRIDGGQPSTGNLVVNNTVLVASDGRWAMNIQDGSSGNTLRNNVFLSDHPSRGSIDLCGSCLPGFVSDHNAVEDRFSLDDVWIDLDQWRTDTGQDGSSFLSTEDELFLDPAAADYRLSLTSPAADSGTATDAPAEDLRGVPRPQEGGWEVGAYEQVEDLLLLADETGRAGELNRFDLFGADPGGTVGLVGSLSLGSTPVPGCPGTDLELAAPKVLATGAADAAGELGFDLTVPVDASGFELYFQGVEPATCELAARIDQSYP